MRPFAQLLLAVLGPAAAAGLAVGAWLGWHYVTAGFPLLLLDAIRRSLLWALAGALVFAAAFELGQRLTRRRLSERFALPLTTAVATAPFVALAGYRLNRALAIRPSEILEPFALAPNLKLLAAGFAAYLGLCALLHFHRKERRWPAIVAVTLAVTLQGGLFALFHSDVKRRPDVLVLLVDALRADHLGSYGYGRATTPAIDSLARDGVVFRQAIAQSTFTKTSIASLFTGRYPYRHGIYWGQRQLTEGALAADLLGEDETTLAEVMEGAGYLTAAWVQNSHLRRVMGFAQGFVDYHDQQGSIDRIHGRFLPWVGGPGRRYSYFAYLHYIDLHDPYRPAPPYDTLFSRRGDGTGADVYRGVDFSRWGAHLTAIRNGEHTLSAADVEELRALYDGQLRAIDDEIGRLLRRLKDIGLYDETLIVVTADHGDAFMEHGFISHSATPYEELVRVPLIMKLPGGRSAGEVVESQVRLVDLMPTLLALADIEADVDVDGCDLVPWIRLGRRPEAADPTCDYAVIEIAEDEGEPALAVRTERFKYIHLAGRDDELYDLAADPGEQNNLATAEEAEPLRRLALDLVARRATGGVDRMELDEQLLRELRALGYVDQ